MVKLFEKPKGWRKR